MSLNFLYESDDELDCATQTKNKEKQVIENNLTQTNISDTNHSDDELDCVILMKTNMKYHTFSKVKTIMHDHNASVTDDNHKIDEDDLSKYIKTYSKYKVDDSCIKNTENVFKSYFLHKKGIVLDNNTYAKYVKNINQDKKRRSIRYANMTYQIKLIFLKKYPTLTQFKNDIEDYYFNNKLICVRSMNHIKWCVSACMIAYSKNIIINIKEEFSEIINYSLIYREIIKHNLNFPLSENI
jgi:hypothetical protein